MWQQMAHIREGRLGGEQHVLSSAASRAPCVRLLSCFHAMDKGIDDPASSLIRGSCRLAGVKHGTTLNYVPQLLRRNH
jgi:hypothetical protein